MTKYNEVKKFFNNEIFSQLPSHHFTSIVGRTTKFAKVIANLNPTLVIPGEHIDKLKTFISYIVWLDSSPTKYDRFGGILTVEYLEEIMRVIVYEIIFCKQMKLDNSFRKPENNTYYRFEIDSNESLNTEDYISILDSLPDLEAIKSEENENVIFEKIFLLSQELYNPQHPIRRFLYSKFSLYEIQTVISDIILTNDYEKIQYKL
jgi:hypothetical protein